jgi:hypothetical protein
MTRKFELVRRFGRGLVQSLTTPIGMLWILNHIIIVLLGVVFLNSQGIQAALPQGVAMGIGGSLIATGIAGASLFLYVLTGESLRSRVEALTKSGIINVFPARSVRIRSEYDDRLRVARQIDLVGYGLSAFRQDYVNDFVTWSERAHVRILLIDPDFPTPETSLADQRDREENHPIGQTRNDVLAFEKAVSELRGLRRDQFQVRRMRSIPSINLFRINDEIFWGPYLMNQQSRNTVTLLVSRNGYLFDMLVGHFEALWAQSSTSPI